MALAMEGLDKSFYDTVHLVYCLMISYGLMRI